MLQIISGKFYKGNDRYSTDCKAILYSNYSWRDTIETCIATLEPVEIYGAVSSYIVRYTNQIEKDNYESKGALVRVGDSEIIRQFRLLTAFGLQAYFDTEKNSVQLLTRKEKIHNHDYILPSLFIRRFLDNGIMGNQVEVERFVEFVNKTIGLERNMYIVIISCISAFDTAIRVIDQDINLAYSIMIYALETLSQSFDGYKSKWEDYDQNQRLKLDRCFEEIDKNKVAEIKNILTNTPHLKLSKRFVEFVLKYVSPKFYIDEAKSIKSAIKKSDLKKLLINAYNMRSGYVHNLRPILKHISIPEMAMSDVIRWENEPYMTFAGLSRLTYHVIYNFVMEQPHIEKEEYNWRNNLPGMITMKMSPQYWIWKHENIKQEHATHRLEGFLTQLVSEDTNISDIRDLLKKYQELIPTSKQIYKVQMLATYCLYNCVITEEYKLDNHLKFLKKHEQIFNICSIENMIVFIYLNEEWPWELEECTETINAYLKRRYKKDNLKVPFKLELAIFISMANKCRKLDLIKNQMEWLEIALYDSSGNEELQEKIMKAIDNKEYVDINKIIIPKSTTENERNQV